MSEQPRPLRTSTRRFVIVPEEEADSRPADFEAAASVPGARIVTTITRLWRFEDAGRCRLCRLGECSLRRVEGSEPGKRAPLLCVVVVERDLPENRDHSMLSNHGGRMKQRMLF